MRIVGEQTMQAILLFTAATIATVHLLVFVRAFLPMHVLLKRIQIEQSQYFAASVICPKWRDDFLFHRTCVSVTEYKNYSNEMDDGVGGRTRLLTLRATTRLSAPPFRRHPGTVDRPHFPPSPASSHSNR